LGHEPNGPAQPEPTSLNGHPPSGFCNNWSRAPPAPTAVLMVGSSAMRAVTVTDDVPVPVLPLASRKLKRTVVVAPLGNSVSAATGVHVPLIKASVGNSVKLIPVEQVHYLRSDEKYTLVVWEGGEALIRKTIRELADELDPDVFVQVHRAVIVNLRQVVQVTRGPNETAEVQMRGRSELLPVSRSYLHVFRQM